MKWFTLNCNRKPVTENRKPETNSFLLLLKPKVIMKKKDMFGQLIDVLVEMYSPKKVILFGSRAWGKPTKDSDIDIFIVKDTKKKPNERFCEVQKLLHGMHKTIPIEPLVMTPKELEKRIRLEDPFILRILNKGKVLYG